MHKRGLAAFGILILILSSISFVSAITFYSKLYQGKTYSNEELVTMGQQMSERADVQIAVEQANERCAVRTTKCDDWMTPSDCSDYLRSKEEDRLADCDYAMLSGAAKAAYTISLRPSQVPDLTIPNSIQTGTPPTISPSFMSGFADTVTGALGQLLNFIKNIFGK